MEDDKPQTALEQIVRTSGQLRPRSRKVYMTGIRSFVTYASANESAWTRDKASKWRESLTARGLNPQTVNLQLRALQFASSRWAQRTGREDFAGGIEALKVKAKARKLQVLTPAQVRRLIDTTHEDRPIDLRDRAVLTVGFKTGLRRSALVSLAFADVLGNFISVNAKGGTRVTIPIDDEARQALQVWMTWLRRNGVHSGPVFRGLAKQNIVSGDVIIRDAAMDVDTVWWLLRDRARMAKLDMELSCSVFRDTFQAWCKTKKIPEERVRALLGRTQDTIAETLQVSDQAPGEELPDILPRKAG